MKELEPVFRNQLSARLATSPEPDLALGLAESVLAAVAPEDLAALTKPAAQPLCDALFVLCGVAPFFAPFLKRHPDWLPRLLAEDDRPLDRETLARRLADLEPATVADASGDAEAALRRLKYYELARITLRDCKPDGLPLDRSGETLAELSQLADVLLEESMRVALARVRERWGPPCWQVSSPADGSPQEVELAFAVIALGKLGGEELNYSSDVDLVYVFETPPDGISTEGDRPSPVEYFTRVAQSFGAIVSTNTSDGFLYRIDLDLRPAGAQGALVISQDALESYYELWADTWEKATFTKARPVAGDLQLGWRAVRAVAPMTYISSMDYAAVRSIRELKEKFEQAQGGHAEGFNVKLDPGGIREIEFIAQAMQMLHGARIPQVRSRGTVSALERLVDVGLLPAATLETLRDDYLFLRRVENRLQMEAERQVHRVPSEPKRATRIARAMGFVSDDGRDAFEAELATRRDRVRDAHAAVLSQDGADQVFELFALGVPQLVAFPSTRRMLEELARQFARAIDASSDPERALNNLDRFIHGIGTRKFYYELLLDRPELVPRLAAMFGASKFLSSTLASHPRLIEPVFHDPNRLLPTPEELRAEWTEFKAEFAADPHNASRDDTELALDALRIFHHRETLNVGLLDVTPAADAGTNDESPEPERRRVGLISRAEAEAALSDLAELCVGAALDSAREQIARTRGTSPEAERAAYIVVAMGKLASRELSYGSDLDVIFLFDSPTEDDTVDLVAQEHFVRLSQRLISALQTPTAEGFCYEIDARLRPSGNQGALVTSLSAFRKYHAGVAQGWERQALLRARAVAGDTVLRDSFEKLRQEILTAHAPADLAQEIHRIRDRMEHELARETQVRRNFKTGRGGVLDVESVVQYLQLAHGTDHPELLRVRRTEEQLAFLHREGLLGTEQAEALAAGWEFLGRLSNRLRIVDNRSISDLDDERGDLEGLAIRLGYESSGRSGGARRALLADYRRHTDAIRDVYNSVIRPSPEASEA